MANREITYGQIDGEIDVQINKWMDRYEEIIMDR